jgi:hypothetical protein
VSGRLLAILAGAGALVLVGLGLALALPNAGCTNTAPTAPGEDPDLLLCRRFAELHNAHGAGAEELLGPAVAIPGGPVTPGEAQRIDTDVFLRSDTLKVVRVRPDTSGGGAPRFLLVTEGPAAGVPLDVRTGDKVSHGRRGVQNPTLVVEVRDGKIYGLRTQITVE